MEYKIFMDWIIGFLEAGFGLLDYESKSCFGLPR